MWSIIVPPSRMRYFMIVNRSYKYSSSTSPEEKSAAEEDNNVSSKDQPPSSSLSSWIPPDRPLVGDKSGVQVATTEITTDSDVEDDEHATIVLDLDDLVGEADHGEEMTIDTVDWLQTRRSVMNMKATGMTAPSRSGNSATPAIELPLKMHTLLSRDEIITFLTSLGAQDIQYYMDDPAYRRMGGADGLIVATVFNNAHLHQLARALQKQLRRRHLQDAGVVGALHGPESSAIDGGHDEGWIVVDCDNYDVHLQEEHMRKAIDLDSLWSGKDDLHRLDFYDEQAVDDYVNNNPAPPDHAMRPSSSSPTSSLDWDAKVKKLQKNRWTATDRKRDMRRNTKKKRRGRGAQARHSGCNSWFPRSSRPRRGMYLIDEKNACFFKKRFGFIQSLDTNFLLTITKRHLCVIPESITS